MKTYYYLDSPNYLGRIITVGPDNKIIDNWLCTNGNWRQVYHCHQKMSDFVFELYKEITEEEAEEMLFIGLL